MAVRSERLYVLQGYIKGKGDQEQLFLHSEKDLALHVAKAWYARGWKPYLFSKTYDGNFKVWFDFRTVKVPAKLRKAA
jgi:hypothetical protein